MTIATNSVFSASREPATNAPATAVWDAGFELLAHAHTGQFCEVWHVRKRATNREYAWKQPRATWVNDPRVQRSFDHEVSVLKHLDSSLVVQHQASHTGKNPRFLVMEWLRGECLETSLSRGTRLSLGKSLRILRQVAQALVELQQAGFSHGQIAPRNIWLTPPGEIRLIDFSTAQPLTAPYTPAIPSRLVQQLATKAQSELESSAALASGLARDLHDWALLGYRLLTGQLPQPMSTEDAALERLPQRRLAWHVPAEILQYLNNVLFWGSPNHPTQPQQLVDQLIGWELLELHEQTNPPDRASTM